MAEIGMIQRTNVSNAFRMLLLVAGYRQFDPVEGTARIAQAYFDERKAALQAIRPG
jgi:hypothetical protein